MQLANVKMDKKKFIYWSYFWAIVWAVFCFASWYSKQEIGTTVALGGIALMFAWIAEQTKLA